MEGIDKQKACSSSRVLIFVEDGYWLELTRESKVGLVRGWESSEWRERGRVKKGVEMQIVRNISHNYYRYYRLVWYICLNTCFQFLNNITCLSTHYFTHTYFQKIQTTLLEQYYQTDPSSKASTTVSFLSLSFFLSDSKWWKWKKFHS